MKSKRGAVLMGLGLLMLLSAVGLAGRNAWEESRAEESAVMLTEELRWQIQTAQAAPEAAEEAPVGAEDSALDPDDYLGVLSIPALGLELPVRAEWSYPNLKKTPCRYVGGAGEEDLVIAAHNYKSHFGALGQLPEGSEVVLETVHGDVLRYKTALTEVLEPTAIEAMTAGEYPLTLFTCTYGGASRVTVRCDWAI